MNRSFASKVLLFGEYSVIQNSNALATPYPLFEGKLAFEKQNKGQRDPELSALARFLKKSEEGGDLKFDFDVSSFSFDVGQGLFFDSTIPQGYGVGSSGALVAALYDRYGQKYVENDLDISTLKARFALMESHFHGSSSGFDPLVSFLNRSILKKRDEGLLTIQFDENPDATGALFLLNTGRSRKTEPLVNLFLEKCKSEEFSYLCEKELTPITNHCIDSFLNHDSISLWEHFLLLSRFQFEHFRPMIPKLYIDLWEQGLESKDYLLKLCGAGGGGFLMGMTRDFKGLTKELDSLEIRPLFKI
ncbi:MAG: mevalonate kinase [Bacteriovoracaceae bacterium]|nr:mevalonate kinase [Bacteriovoracaceae bacterium]